MHYIQKFCNHENAFFVFLQMQGFDGFDGSPGAPGRPVRSILLHMNNK